MPLPLLLPVVQQYRQAEFGLGGGGNWGLRNVEVS